MSQGKRIPFFIGLAIIIIAAFAMIVGHSHVRRAESAHARKDYAGASSSYARAAQILFWRGDLWEMAGISAARGNDFQTALAYFSASPDLSEEGWLWLATSHFQLGDMPSAIRAAEEGARHFDSARLYRLLAFAHRNQQDWQSERLALENQLRLESNDAYAHYRLGLLLTLSSPQLALNELTLASSLNPEVDSAVQTLRSALALSGVQPDESQKLLTIGRALGLVQEWELSLAAFERAVQADPKNAEAWAWLGEAKQQTGQEGSAELDTALSLDRMSVNVRALRALYWSRQGNHRQALEEYLAAAETEPENPAWQAGIGDAYVKLGDLIAALTAYQRAVELAPDETRYWRLLAVFCAENSVYVEEIGLPAAQQAVTLAPDDPFALDTLGYLYFSSGRYASAGENLLRAIEIAPEHFSAHIHLAMNYLAQGNRAAAFNSLTYVRDADSSGIYRETAMRLLGRYFP